MRFDMLLIPAMPMVLGARCGESSSPVLSPGSKEPRRETGPAAMGHPPWGSPWCFSSIAIAVPASPLVPVPPLDTCA